MHFFTFADMKICSSYILGLWVVFCFFTYPSNAQLDRYSAKDNSYYWKNRPPFAGYWQQDVYYKIKATIDEKTDIISGEEELTYRNNSPDTLKEVFFHLYQNAFTPHSYLDDLTTLNRVNSQYGKYESQGLGITIDQINLTNMNGTSNDSPVKITIDNTILKVHLPQGLLPGKELTFSISFKTYYDRGSQRRRMQVYNSWGNKHYNGCQWFPKLSVYDRKIGWDTQQHLGKEFYGNFGDFDVELTFANQYILEATGTLTNETEVLPGELRAKLDIKNFAERKPGAPPTVVIVPNGTTKTWKYHAENVHDFAFTADPTYRLGKVTWNGIRCIAIACEPNAWGWQNAADYTSKIVEVYSRDFGAYAYPKMVVADARDGMEYPMLTLCSGSDPGFRSLLCHEIGHNWFYGMVGSNETYRPIMDEGFTQFINAWALSKLEGTRINGQYKPLQLKPSTPLTHQYNTAYSNYLHAAVADEDGWINTHSDMFTNALGHGGGYGMVYRKTATMLYNLQYVLGDELFLAAMQHYFNQWEFCHPYPEDFRNSVTETVKYDLTWFFDQWLETDKKIDYKVCRVRQADSSNTYTIRFKRKGEMQSPVDFTVYTQCGTQHSFHIPNTWFVKQTDAMVLPKWEGWGKLRNTYNATVKIPCGISNVVIDTTNRLADINRLNSSLHIPFKLLFDKWQKPAYSDWEHYVIYTRPDVWYNNYDGIKIGVHAEGNYMRIKHLFSADFWLNTALGRGKLPEETNPNKNDPASFRLFYKTALTSIYSKLNIYASAAFLDGLTRVSPVVEIVTRNSKTKFFAEYKLMCRSNAADLDYLLYPTLWQANKFNNNLRLGISQNYNTSKIYGSLTLGTSSNSIYSEYNYSTIYLTNTLALSTGKLDWRSRFFLQYGSGTNVPHESALYLAGANPEQLMDNAYTRSAGFVPTKWAGYGDVTRHFQQGGGLNLRGYAGYLVPEGKGVSQQYLFKGTSGTSLSVEMEGTRLINWKPKITRNWLKCSLYAFADAGTINTNKPDENLKLSGLRMDAGIGTALTIKKWGMFNAINPLTIRFDLPLWLNAPPAAEKGFTQFRYVIGIGRSF